jgi:predicted acetyltransferase
MDETRIRVGAADDWESISAMLAFAFHHNDDPDLREVEGSVFEPERSLVAEDAGTLVGHAAAYSRELSVPGGVLPAAYVSLVGVAPTHRRQGLLTRLMQRQLDDIAAAGRESLAVLWASEGRIYPRFGYGLAGQRLELEVAVREIRPPQIPPAPDSRLRLVDPADAAAEFAKVYDQLRPERPGFASRDDRWWRFVLSDLEFQREGGATALRAVVHDTPHGPTGYAVWRSRSRWDATGPDGSVQVREVVAADPAAYAALWRLLLSIDLTRTTSFPFATLDEPLLHLVDEPRRLGPRQLDSLWVRVIDVGRALAGRRYRTDVDVVLDVTDAQLPANTGRWRLTGGPDGATCRPTGDPADLACTTLELGAAYLGGTSLSALAAADRVRELRPGALDAASTAFGWHRLPAAIEMF